MSPEPTENTQPFEPDDRRLYPRRKIGQLVPVEFDSENGGILLELSRGGICFQGVGVMSKGQFVRLRFKLPATDTRIDTTAQVVWLSESGKAGGLRFVNLNPVMQNRIKEWIAGDAAKAVATETREVPSPIAAKAVSADDQTLTPVLPPADSTGLPGQFPPSSPPAPQQPAPFSRMEILDPQPLRTARRRSLRLVIGLLAASLVAEVAVITADRKKDAPLPLITSSSAQAEENSSFPVRDFVVDAFDIEKHHWILSNNPADANPTDAPAPPQSLNSEAAPVARAENPESHANPAPARTADSSIVAIPAPVSPPAGAGSGEPAPGASVAPEPGATQADAFAPGMPVAQPSQPQPAPPPDTFQEAILIHSAPSVPPRRMKKGIDGIVQVSFTIGADGVPRDMQVVRGDLSLAPAAIDAISTWRYLPAVHNGRPVPSAAVVSLNFQPK